MKITKPSKIIAVFSIISILGINFPGVMTKAEGDIYKIELDPTISVAQQILEDKKNEIDKVTNDANERIDKVISDEIEIQDRIQDIIDQEVTEQSEPEPIMTPIGTYELTAYIATGSPCASGVYPTVNHTVACNSLPLGTKIYIEGLGEYVVEDTGGMAGNVIDVFVSDYGTAINFGRRVATVYVIQ